MVPRSMSILETPLGKLVVVEGISVGVSLASSRYSL